MKNPDKTDIMCLYSMKQHGHQVSPTIMLVDNAIQKVKCTQILGLVIASGME